MIGSQLGQFRITAKLGEGGMGEVYRAEDLRLEREVAIKVLPEEFARDAERLERFAREAKAVAALSHPNILAIYDFGNEDGVVFAVIELLEGETLRDRLASRAIPARKAIDYGAQIARGLAAAHEKGIVHRDLKPENIFLTPTGQVKILDFGLAKMDLSTDGQTLTYGPGTAPGTVLGTVGYMSPEQVRGVEVDTRSDIFSFGCVLYEMIAGKAPFRGESAVEAMSAILKEEPAELESSSGVLSPGIDRLVRHCLEKEPAERFQSARDLAFDLDALKQPSSISSVTSSSSQGLPRRRRAVLAGIAFLALLGVLLAFWIGRQGKAPAGLDVEVIRQLTFDPQAIFNARFGPDGETVVFSAAGNGSRPRIYRMRPGEVEAEDLDLDATHLLAISSQGEMALLTQAQYQYHRVFSGTLARLSMSGGAPKEILKGVSDADWSPDGRELAVVRTVEGVARLEYPIGNVLLELAGTASDLRVSPDGDRIAYFDHPSIRDNRGSVAVATKQGSAEVLSGPFYAAEGLVWDEDGGSVLFTASMGSDLGAVAYRVSLEGDLVPIYSAMGDLKILDVGAQGRWLTLQDSILPEIFARGPLAPEERQLGWRSWPVGSLISRDGSLLLFSDQSSAAGPGYGVAMQGIDGSAIIELGTGFPFDLSPDKAWVLTLVLNDPREIWLYPTGPGEARRVESAAISNPQRALFFENGSSILVCGHPKVGAPRCFEVELDSSQASARTPENTFWGAPSPDGKEVAARTDEGWRVFVAAEGEGRLVPGVPPRDYLVRWAPEGRRLWFARASDEARTEIYEVDLETGEIADLIMISPSDRRGIISLDWISLADNPTSYAYTARRRQSALFEILMKP